MLLCRPVLANELTVADPRIRLPLPGQSTAVAYCVIINSTGRSRELAAVAVERAERAEMHEHRLENGMMRMRAVDTLTVPAGGELEFRPHGYHIMVFGLQADSSPDPQRQYQLEFRFRDGEIVHALADVIR